jgi:hypothetical protein
VIIQGEARVGPAGPVDKQHHRLGPGRIDQGIGIRHRQRAQTVPGLPATRSPSRLVASTRKSSQVAISPAKSGPLARTTAAT